MAVWLGCFQELDESVGLWVGIRGLGNTARAIPSHLHYGFGVSGGQGVHVGEDELFGAVAAELLDVLLSTIGNVSSM